MTLDELLQDDIAEYYSEAITMATSEFISRVITNIELYNDGEPFDPLNQTHRLDWIHYTLQNL